MIWGCAQVVDGLFMRLLSRSLARRWLRYRRCYEWQRMTPARRAFHECRMQFPRHCVSPRNHIVGIATFADTVESSPNRIACETAPSALAACAPRRARGPTHSCVGSTLRAWVRYCGRGPPDPRVGPIPRTWARYCGRGPPDPRVVPMVCAWAAPPSRISWGWRACHGVNAHVQRFMCERHARSGAVASTTQATLPATPRCRRLLSRWFATWAPRCPEA